MKHLLLKILIVSIIGTGMFMSVQDVQAAWLTGYDYRKEITITGQSGAGTNYQVLLKIGSSSGRDLHLDGNASNFPNDIAFTDSDETTELDYWVEDPTADPIRVWVEVTDDLGSNVTIYARLSANLRAPLRFSGCTLCG